MYISKYGAHCGPIEQPQPYSICVLGKLFIRYTQLHRYITFTTVICNVNVTFTIQVVRHDRIYHAKRNIFETFNTFSIIIFQTKNNRRLTM